MKRPAVYMMASRRNGTVYTGVTSNLLKRAYEHKHGLADGFTKQYACKTLVFIEYHEAMEFAILREKQIKPAENLCQAHKITRQEPCQAPIIGAQTQCFIARASQAPYGTQIFFTCVACRRISSISGNSPFAGVGFPASGTVGRRRDAGLLKMETIE